MSISRISHSVYTYTPPNNITNGITTYIIPLADKHWFDRERLSSDYLKAHYDANPFTFIENQEIEIASNTVSVAFKTFSPEGFDQLTQLIRSNSSIWRGGSVQLIHIDPRLLNFSRDCKTILSCKNLSTRFLEPVPSSPSHSLESPALFNHTEVLDSAGSGSIELHFRPSQFPLLRRLSITFDKKQKMAAAVTEIPKLDRIVAYRLTDESFWNSLAEKGPTEVYQVLGSASISKSRFNNRLTKLGLHKVKGLEDISFFENFPNVTELVIIGANKIVNFQPLLKLTKLEILELTDVRNSAQAISLFAKHRPEVKIV